jgi:SpoVK/Ycf46/Vps4 family AAA+-type ATPase
VKVPLAEFPAELAASLGFSCARVTQLMDLLLATNHVGLLDQALFRRFDAVFDYELPTRDIAIEVMKARLALLETAAVDWEAALESAEGLTGQPAGCERRVEAPC